MCVCWDMCVGLNFSPFQVEIDAHQYSICSFYWHQKLLAVGCFPSTHRRIPRLATKTAVAAAGAQSQCESSMIPYAKRQLMFALRNGIVRWMARGGAFSPWPGSQRVLLTFHCVGVCFPWLGGSQAFNWLAASNSQLTAASKRQAVGGSWQEGCDARHASMFQHLPSTFSMPLHSIYFRQKLNKNTHTLNCDTVAHWHKLIIFPC